MAGIFNFDYFGCSALIILTKLFIKIVFKYRLEELIRLIPGGFYLINLTYFTSPIIPTSARCVKLAAPSRATNLKYLASDDFDSVKA